MFEIVGPNGEESGPADMATLLSWVAQGRIQPHTTIIDTATGQRYAAGIMPALETAFRSLSSQSSVKAAINQSVKSIVCPVCSRHVSSRAVSCPNCGHPISPVDNWAQIRLVGNLVCIVIGILILGAQTVFLKLVSGGGVGADTLLQVFLQTAPLTIAVTIISLAVVKEWINDLGPLLFWSSVVLGISLILGSWLGGLGKIPSIQGNPLQVIFGMLAFYWNCYGPSLFVSSLILGVFLAWGLNKLWPNKPAGTPTNTGSGK